MIGFARLTHKGAFVHAGDPNRVNMGCSAREAILHPPHKDSVETSRLVMRIAGHSREATPFVRALAKNTVFATWSRRPIENRRIPCNERWTCAEGIRNFLTVSYRVLRDCLSSQRPANQHDRH